MDMSAMIAAAQQHMQKNLTAKLASIGVPMTTFGISTAAPGGETESIPLPEDPIGVDMGIADTDIPLPGLPAAVHLLSMYRNRLRWSRTLLYALLLSINTFFKII